MSWDTANDAVLVQGGCVLIGDSARSDGVTVLGGDEPVWRHSRYGETFVNVTIGLPPIYDGVGLPRPLDMVTVRSKQAFRTSVAATAWK